ncbi:MAG: hypothetical protein HQK50_02695 [Oligoflexia bacterium]|nr:hypothetical protein [Oligoflexia bacterium]MBF0364449.1 hypothetical protein [Oligoflexia bacterium]
MKYLLQYPKTSLGFLIVIFFCSFLYLAFYHYPFMGADYSFHSPKLIETADFIKKNPFAIQYYSRALGGIPYYGLPENNQFSLLQYSFVLFPPLIAYMVTLFIYLLFGGMGAYLLFRKSFALESESAIIGALLWISNGFYTAHMLVGHYSYVHFITIPLVCFLYFESLRRSNRIYLLGAALLSASYIYSGGYFTTLLLFLSILLLVLFFKIPWSFKSYVLLTTVTVAIAASRLWAIITTIPLLYHDYRLPTTPTFFEALMINVSAYFVPPRRFYRGSISDMISWWEFCQWVCPLALLLLLPLRKQIAIKLPNTFRGWINIGTVIFIVLFSGGFFLELFSKVPILNSYWVPMRFGALLILPLIFLYLLLYSKWKLSKQYLLMAGIAILAMHLFVFHSLIKKGREGCGMWYFVEKEIFWKRQPPLPPITRLEKSDDLAILRGALNLRAYEGEFGYNLEGIKKPLAPGSALEQFRNPACLLYPKENSCAPWDLIQKSDQENLQRFLHNLAPKWKISLSQKVANSISLLTLLTLAAIFTLTLFYKRSRRSKCWQ